MYVKNIIITEECIFKYVHCFLSSFKVAVGVLPLAELSPHVEELVRWVQF